jgi:hypothetical protein
MLRWPSQGMREWGVVEKEEATNETKNTRAQSNTPNQSDNREMRNNSAQSQHVQLLRVIDLDLLLGASDGVRNVQLKSKPNTKQKNSTTRASRVRERERTQRIGVAPDNERKYCSKAAAGDTCPLGCGGECAHNTPTATVQPRDRRTSGSRRKHCSHERCASTTLLAMNSRSGGCSTAHSCPASWQTHMACRLRFATTPESQFTQRASHDLHVAAGTNLHGEGPA